jgi:hypothetical protein
LDRAAYGQQERHEPGGWTGTRSSWASAIDELHREFQMLLDRLIDCGCRRPAPAGTAEHLLRHCGTEEEWMRQERLPATAQARAQKLLVAVGNAPQVRRRRPRVSQAFSSDLLPWFAVHAQTMDAPLAEFLKGS